MTASQTTRFLPGRHPIDAYGDGGFRFGGMSHRGSILALPSGMHAWPATDAHDLDAAAFAAVLAEADDIDFLVVGCGAQLVPLSATLQACFREAAIGVDVLSTGTAARTYNVLMAENRKAAAALIAVD